MPMGIAGFLNWILDRKETIRKEQLLKLRELPEARLQAEMGVVLHDVCVRHAAGFVKEELSRGASPFRGVERTAFFHEIMILNLWILDKTLAEKDKAVVSEVCRNYIRYFHVADGQREDHALNSIFEKHRVYYEEWDEVKVTGRHDKFGFKVAELVMGGNSGNAPPEQALFWIISYTESAMKVFRNIRKKCLANGIRIR